MQYFMYLMHVLCRSSMHEASETDGQSLERSREGADGGRGWLGGYSLLCRYMYISSIRIYLPFLGEAFSLKWSHSICQYPLKWVFLSALPSQEIAEMTLDSNKVWVIDVIFDVCMYSLKSEVMLNLDWRDEGRGRLRRRGDRHGRLRQQRNAHRWQSIVSQSCHQQFLFDYWRSICWNFIF